MVNSVPAQLKNAETIKSVIKSIDVGFKLADGRCVETLILYIPSSLQGGGYDYLFEIIKSDLLHNFVFSCKEIEDKLGLEMDGLKKEKIIKKAIRKLSKKTAKGELGELILFTILDVYIGAPKLLSKVSLKTNRKMPVFGADAVHGKFIGNDFVLYLGESKLHKSFSSASTKAASSIKSSLEKYDEEFDLLDSYIDYPGISGKQRGALIELLDPFSNSSIVDDIESPCFIGFSEINLVSKCESEFIEEYIDMACNLVENFFEKVEKKSGSIERVSLFLLPFSCVDDLVSGFVDYFGIK